MKGNKVAVNVRSHAVGLFVDFQNAMPLQINQKNLQYGILAMLKTILMRQRAYISSFILVILINDRMLYAITLTFLRCHLERSGSSIIFNVKERGLFDGNG